ncbi:MAG: baseplate protein J, partial [Dolichospermum sp.]
TLVVVKDDDHITSKETTSYPKLFQFLDQRRLLTTRIHLVNPKYISVNLETTLVIEDGIKPNAVDAAIAGKLSF